jgi:hypothetical protein
MPAESKKQQRFFGMVHAVQKGELSPSEVGPAVRKAAKNTDYSDAKDIASTKHKNLPEKKGSIQMRYFEKNSVAKVTLKATKKVMKKSSKPIKLEAGTGSVGAKGAAKHQKPAAKKPAAKKPAAKKPAAKKPAAKKQEPGYNVNTKVDKKDNIGRIGAGAIGGGLGLGIGSILD